MMAVAELPPLVPTLASLAHDANEHHSEVERAESSALRHAITAGEALLQAREVCAPGEWADWVRENLDFSKSTCDRYMRFAKFRAEVQHCRTILEARAVLENSAFSRASDTRPPRKYSPRTEAEACALRVAGHTYKQIAERLQINVAAAQYLCNRDLRIRQTNEAARRRAAENREARKILDRDSFDRRLKRLGGDAATTYSFIRQACQAADRAREQAEDPAIKMLYTAALDALYKAEDQLKQVVGQS